MFQPGALRGFVLAETDPKRDSTVYTLTNRDSVIKIEVLDQIDAQDAQTLLQDGGWHLAGQSRHGILTPKPLLFRGGVGVGTLGLR